MLLALCGLSAWFGAIGLASGTLPLDGALRERLPGHSTVFAGIALALVVALPMSTAAVLVLRRQPRARLAGAAAGMLLVGWIAVELMIIRQFSWLQPACAVAGAALAVRELRGRRGRVPAGVRDTSPT